MTDEKKPKADMGRLCSRDEGEFVVAYWAPSQTSMDGAHKLGAIRKSIIQGERPLFDAWLVLMKRAMTLVIHEVAGARPTWGEPVVAPEHERGVKP